MINDYRTTPPPNAVCPKINNGHQTKPLQLITIHYGLMTSLRLSSPFCQLLTITIKQNYETQISDDDDRDSSIFCDQGESTTAR